MKKVQISVLIGIIICCFTCSITVTATHKDYSTEELLDTMNNIINWKKSEQGLNPEDSLLNSDLLEEAGETQADWYALGIGRSGYIDRPKEYASMLSNYVTEKYKKEEKLDATKTTEWHRIALTMLALGSDPTDVGNEHIDLIADGTYNRSKVSDLGMQGLNGYVWALIAMDSMRYPVPEGAADTRASVIENILKRQLTCGGFALDTESMDPDVDLTAMAIQALAPYYNSERKYMNGSIKVRTAINRAITCLSDIQETDGGYRSWGTDNTESAAQVITALTALGIDPQKDPRFIKNGHTVLSGMMQYRNSDGGFIHSKTYDENNPKADPDQSNSMASEQAYYALTALCRYYGNLRSLYDCREEQPKEQKESIAKVEKDILCLKKNSSKKEITKVYEEYQTIPAVERSYVYHYYILSKLLSENKIPLKADIAMEQETTGKIGSYSLYEHSSQLSADLQFTDQDVKKIEQLATPVTTKDESKVITLLDKLQNATNKKEYKEYEAILLKRKQQITSIKNKIESINQEILEDCYPVEKISLDDEKVVTHIQKEIKTLSSFDRKKIVSYKDIMAARKKIENLKRQKWVRYSIIAVIILVVLILGIRRSRRKRKKEFAE